MKVLQLVDTMSAGGAERVLATVARVGPPMGIDIDVAALSGGGDARVAMVPVLESAGVIPVTFDFRRLADPAALRRLVRHVRAHRYDVLHAHLEYSAIVGTYVAAVCHLPLVVTLHHVRAPARWRQATIEWFAVEGAGRRASRMVFVSEASRASFATRYHTRPTWMVVPNGIELPGNAPAHKREPTAPSAVLVGNMRHGKGHVEAIEAWPEVSRRVPGARLVFVGSGSLEPGLRRRAAACGVADRIVFAGFQQETQSAMAAADLVLLPSHQEALPTVLMEAAALGRAVVATRVGGVPEVVDDGVTGVLVPPSDRASLVDAVASLLSDDPRRERLGQAARRRAEECFDARLWVTRLGDIYKSACLDARARVGAA